MRYLHVIAIAAALLSACGAIPQQSSLTLSRAGAHAADIAVYRRDFLAVDKAFSPAARADAEARLARLEKLGRHMSEAYFELELARITALADNGHTLDFPFIRAMHTNRVPVRLGLFGEEYYVLRATEAKLLGARLTAIDGRQIAQVRNVARSLVGGVTARRDTFGADFLESPEQLAALNVIARRDCAAYSFILRNGRELTQRLCGEAPSPTRLTVASLRVYFPEPVTGEGSNWKTALAAEAAPWALRDPDEPFRWRAAPEIDGLVIEFRSNSDMPNAPIADFVARVRHAIDTLHPRNIVLDERLNYPGGDMQATRAFAEALPREASGHIFVLTSPWTFSAAIATAAYAKQAAPDRVSIVGETAGDRLQFFAEGRSQVVLPNSQARINYATQREDFQNGCRGFTDCNRYLVHHPITLPTLAPDIPAPWTVAAYLAGRDPGMEAVARMLASRQ